jgi:hypothetical protein
MRAHSRSLFCPQLRFVAPVPARSAGYNLTCEFPLAPLLNFTELQHLNLADNPALTASRLRSRAMNACPSRLLWRLRWCSCWLWRRHMPLHASPPKRGPRPASMLTQLLPLLPRAVQGSFSAIADSLADLDFLEELVLDGSTGVTGPLSTGGQDDGACLLAQVKTLHPLLPANCCRPTREHVTWGVQYLLCAVHVLLHAPGTAF